MSEEQRQKLRQRFLDQMARATIAILHSCQPADCISSIQMAQARPYLENLRTWSTDKEETEALKRWGKKPTPTNTKGVAKIVATDGVTQ